VIDLGGKVLMPGMLDSHSHAIKGGLQLELANLAGEEIPSMNWSGACTNGARMAKPCVASSSRRGVPGTYWDDIPALAQRFNHGEWADQPILFAANDMHTGWASQAMLKRAGIDAKTIAALPAEARNTIGQHQDGTPNGFLADASYYPVTDLLPPLSRDTLMTAGRMAWITTSHWASPAGWTRWPTNCRAPT
jgi:predicted amidohydrolase YtcJ